MECQKDNLSSQIQHADLTDKAQLCQAIEMVQELQTLLV